MAFIAFMACPVFPRFALVAFGRGQKILSQAPGIAGLQIQCCVALRVVQGFFGTMAPDLELAIFFFIAFIVFMALAVFMAFIAFIAFAMI